MIPTNPIAYILHWRFPGQDGGHSAQYEPTSEGADRVWRARDLLSEAGATCSVHIRVGPDLLEYPEGERPIDYGRNLQIPGATGC